MPDGREAARYRPEVLEALRAHGLAPGGDTPPRLVREQLNDLYRAELRQLRARLLSGGIEKREYAAHVVAVRNRFPLLSVPLHFWTE